MIAVPSQARFWDHVDAMVAQSQERVRTFRQVLGEALSRRTPLTLVVTGMRHRMDAVLLQGEPLLRAFRQLRGHLSPRKTMLTFVAAGVVGLTLIIVLLEISMRNELAKEHAGTGISAAPILSTSPERTAFDDAFAIQPTIPAGSEFVDRVRTSGATPIPEGTFGQVSREPVPLPRPRPKHR
jgi:hypothetical protein